MDIPLYVKGSSEDRLNPKSTTTITETDLDDLENNDIIKTSESEIDNIESQLQPIKKDNSEYINQGTAANIVKVNDT